MIQLPPLACFAASIQSAAATRFSSVPLPVGVEHFHRVHARTGRDSDDADVVVERADDSGDVRAVQVVVVVVVLLRERVVAAGDVRGEIGDAGSRRRYR